MYYKVTNIEFDFDYEDITQEEQDALKSDVTDCLWHIANEDDLADTITDNTGWCIKCIEYVNIP